MKTDFSPLVILALGGFKVRWKQKGSSPSGTIWGIYVGQSLWKKSIPRLPGPPTRASPPPSPHSSSVKKGDEKDGLDNL